MTSLKLEGPVTSLTLTLDPPCSSCGGEVEPIHMSCMVRSTGLIGAVLERSARQAWYRDPGDDDDLGLVTVPLKLKLGTSLCTRLWFKA